MLLTRGKDGIGIQAIQWQVVVELRDQDVSQKAGASHAAWYQTAGRRLLPRLAVNYASICAAIMSRISLVSSPTRRVRVSHKAIRERTELDPGVPYRVHSEPRACPRKNMGPADGNKGPSPALAARCKSAAVSHHAARQPQSQSPTTWRCRASSYHPSDDAVRHQESRHASQNSHKTHTNDVVKHVL
ncbi:hypothetical protein MJ8_14050 [Mesorhizobium sp. J8]|nr:hypothetical protein MJ8_14050 [Mesorhizobium sp. J8]